MGKTWTVLLQGCTEAPALLGQALQKISQEFTPPPGIGLMQDVDDLPQSGGQKVVEEASVKWLNVQAKKHL